ncbi:3e209b66-f234-474a-9bba-7620827d6fc6 [Thermothielavioides terrestris]|uniref:3e209b66-f234-474a-9bba-7620827d6fc6 n=1 Tax=Thermothielavioides terrestris TaxID=2587410 RepID=A0A3S4B4I4_9PEZI|nr:3e209b66-f234-474a-9bba-7620827d6fc6 [Thermothielavioides terrestris]
MDTESPAHESFRQAGLHVLLPSDKEYALRQESYFSRSAAQVAPACIIRPRSASEVSAAIRILTKGRHLFAIRSGGHGTNVGASNIAGGVTLDLGLLDWTRVEDDGQHEPVVDIGPGARWADVYASLQERGLVVAGGREGSVGVGGLILGGGFTYFTASHGFACDNVLAFEVVLADGRIVNATAECHADLFWALKGGSNNFGVVTNFRMRALRGGAVWGGLTLYPWQVLPQAIEALTDFTSLVHTDPELKQVTIVSVFAQVGGVERAPAYEKWLALPSIHTDCKMTSLSNIVAENIMPSGYYHIWFTATIKNDARIVSKAASLQEELVNTLKTSVAPDGDFWALCLLQPLPKIMAQRGGNNNNNALGLSRQQHDGLLLQTTVMVRTPEQERMAYPKCKAFIVAVRDFARSTEMGEDGNLDWEYLNYADGSQDPLASYGAENVKRLKEVSLRYDPEQAFQRLCPGGFKLAHVST